jgi:hypothetical protein
MTEIWFLVVSYTQIVPAYDGRPSHRQGAASLEAVYLDDGECWRAANRLKVPASSPGRNGRLWRNVNVSKRCVKSQAPLEW